MKLEDARETCADATERREECWRDAMKAQGRETASSLEERYNRRPSSSTSSSSSSSSQQRNDRSDERGGGRGGGGEEGARADGGGGGRGLIMVDGTETCLVEELDEKECFARQLCYREAMLFYEQTPCAKAFQSFADPADSASESARLKVYSNRELRAKCVSISHDLSRCLAKQYIKR